MFPSETVKWLVNQGCDVHAKSTKGNKAQDVAKSHSHGPVVKYLREAGKYTTILYRIQIMNEVNWHLINRVLSFLEGFHQMNTTKNYVLHLWICIRASQEKVNHKQHCLLFRLEQIWMILTFKLTLACLELNTVDCKLLERFGFLDLKTYLNFQSLQ